MNDNDEIYRPGNTVNCLCSIYEIGKEGPTAVILENGEEFSLNPFDMGPYFERRGLSIDN